jgi:hypothetical protein
MGSTVPVGDFRLDLTGGSNSVTYRDVSPKCPRLIPLLGKKMRRVLTRGTQENRKYSLLYRYLLLPISSPRKVLVQVSFSPMQHDRRGGGTPEGPCAMLVGCVKKADGQVVHLGDTCFVGDKLCPRLLGALVRGIAGRRGKTTGANNIHNRVTRDPRGMAILTLRKLMVGVPNGTQ